MYKDFLNCVLTEGFKSFCEEHKCYWLFTDLASILMIKNKPYNNLNKKDAEHLSLRTIADFKQEGFIVAFIKVNQDKTAEVKLYRDYDKNNEQFNKENLLYQQNHNYTDLDLKEFSFYICLNEINTFTFMLKEEY